MKSSGSNTGQKQPRPAGPVRPAGFSLLEVVVAVAITGIAFGALLSAFSLSLRNLGKVDAYHMAVQLAENKMNELLLDETVINSGELSGEWENGLSWRASLSTREIDDLKVDKNRLSTQLLDIKLTVYYEDGKVQRQTKLFTVKLVPKPSAAGGRVR